MRIGLKPWDIKFENMIYVIPESPGNTLDRDSVVSTKEFVYFHLNNVGP